MSEEQPVESEKPEGKAELEPQPEMPWSAPPITEAPEQSADLEPLKPLESNLADMMSDALTPPAYPEMDSLFSDLEPPVTEEPRPLLRPVAVISTEYCREGLLGVCVSCQGYPCQYMLGRALRHLLAKVEYGQN